jgi:hypothetical protein
MDVKGYLYMICTIGTVVMGMNISRRGVAGPATLTLFLLPVLGLIALMAFDMYVFLQRRLMDDSDRPVRRRRRRPRDDRDDDRY